jgi:transcriptional regulator with XRE-family HTH domain
LSDKTYRIGRGATLLRPKTAEDFEALTRALFARLHDDPHADLYGRSGQSQGGVDVLCKDREGRRIGVQCKLSVADPYKAPSVAQLRADVEAARRAHPDLAQFIFLSSAPADKHLKDAARQLSQENLEQKLFTVDYHAWGWFEDKLREFPDLCVRYELVATAEAQAPTSTIMHQIGERLGQALDLMNQDREPNARFTLQQLSRLLSVDWRELENIQQGVSSASSEDLHRLAVRLGVRPEWLIEGKEEPFSREEDAYDAARQFDAILALAPTRIVFARSCEDPFFALVAVQVDEARWRVFDPHPAGPDLGATGRSQLFEFIGLIRRLHLHYGLEMVFAGQHVTGDQFQDLLSGQSYPGQILDQVWNDPWWRDLAELAPQRVEGDDAAAAALRSAIGVAQDVLALHQAEAGVAWRRDRLVEANLPLDPDGGLLLRLPEEDTKPLSKPAPVEPLVKGDWPRVMALGLQAATFSFHADGDKIPTEGFCDIDIVNQTKITLERCSVVITAISRGQSATMMDLPWRLGPVAAGDGEGFSLRRGEKKRLGLARRDLTDIINRPPWTLRIVDRKVGLDDNRTYTLWLELRSSYDFPTKVQLTLKIAHGRDVAAVIGEQTV